MKAHRLAPTALIACFLLSTPIAAESPAVRGLLEQWQPRAELSFSATRGEALWFQQLEGRSCTSCHSDSLTVSGQHERTGKIIEAMAPSKNPERLTDQRKIKKWLRRNCKWTYGRICTTQEKGDLLSWLTDQ